MLPAYKYYFAPMSDSPIALVTRPRPPLPPALNPPRPRLRDPRRAGLQPPHTPDLRCVCRDCTAHCRAAFSSLWYNGLRSTQLWECTGH